MAKRKKIDWDAIEKEYRLGQKTLRTIAAEFKTTAGAISKKSKKENWYQDKSSEVIEKTNAALLKETKNGNKEGNTPNREDIEKAVRTNVEIIRGHRKDISGGRQIVELLQSQLMESALNRDEIEEEIIKETEGVDKPDLKRRNRMLKAVSLPAHAGTMRDLSTALKNLIHLERQAFNLDDDTAGNAMKGIIERLSPASRQKLTDILNADSN